LKQLSALSQKLLIARSDSSAPSDIETPAQAKTVNAKKRTVEVIPHGELGVSMPSSYLLLMTSSVLHNTPKCA
jgi:hypothetical protein